MKLNVHVPFLVFVLALSLVSCESKDKPMSNDNSLAQTEETTGIMPDFQGIYQGVQPAYNLKNEYGDELIIKGKPVSVPSIDFKFLLKANFVVSLQQINLEDNSRVYYQGNFKILEDSDQKLVILCELHDGEGSNPTYTLYIDKLKRIASCMGANEPAFKVEKKE